MVRFSNGKEYPVMRQKKRYHLLLLVEYMAYFVASSQIIQCRTSDYVGHTNPKNLSKDNNSLQFLLGNF